MTLTHLSLTRCRHGRTPPRPLTNDERAAVLRAALRPALGNDRRWKWHTPIPTLAANVVALPTRKRA